MGYTSLMQSKMHYSAMIRELISPIKWMMGVAVPHRESSSKWRVEKRMRNSKGFVHLQCLQKCMCIFYEVGGET